jgi:hypothetical protein
MIRKLHRCQEFHKAFNLAMDYQTANSQFESKVQSVVLSYSVGIVLLIVAGFWDLYFEHDDI